jgi:hypothetical protein
MAQKFPTFKYSGVTFNPAFAAPDAPALSFGSNPGVAPSFSGTDLTLDKALAYGVMQALNPEERAKARKQEMQDALEYQKLQMKEAYPYALSRQIPETISQAFGLANQMRLRGGELGTAAALRGVDAVAQGRFAPYGALPEFSYFS